MRLHVGLRKLGQRGFPLESIPPEGAIYLAARIHPFGRRTPGGTLLETNEGIRRFLLESCGIGVVPFQAFGTSSEDGWFRLSVGAVSEAEISDALVRLERAFDGVFRTDATLLCESLA